MERKQNKKLEQRERERIRQEFFINKILEDDGNSYHDMSSGYSEKQKNEIRIRKEREMNERKDRNELLRKKDERMTELEFQVLQNIAETRFTKLNNETLNLVEHLLKQGRVSGLIQNNNQQNIFVRIDRGDLDKIALYVESKGKVTKKDLSTYIELLFESTDV